MNKPSSLIFCVVLLAFPAFADTPTVNLTEMGVGLCVARQSVPAPATAPSGEISLLVLPAEPATFAKSFSGVRVLLCNRTDKEVSLPTCDSILFIVQEAQDAQGVWQPIERRATSWCGNSYFSMELPTGQAWQLTAPKYSGPFKTKLRFKLLTEEPIYSKEFDGAINPSQLVPNEKSKIPKIFYGALEP